METVNIPTFLNIDLSFTIASSGRRFGAFFIDWALKVAYFFFMASYINVGIFSDSLLFSFIIYFPFLFYSFLFEWLNKGQSLGKMLLGIRVIGMNGNYPSPSQCGIRWMFLLADAYLFALLATVNTWLAAFTIFSPLVGAIFIGATKTHQRLGDFAAQTYVVSTKENHYSIYDTIYGYVSDQTNYVVKYPEVMRLSDKDMTVIQDLLEKSEVVFDENLARRLALHVKKVLKIESTEKDFAFLKNLLKDYNYLSINEKK